MRVVMIEPQGQGGICHYSYSLCTGLHETQNADVRLVTGQPYELIDAPRSFAATTTFGPGMERKAIQWMLRRPDLRQQAQPIFSSPPSSTARAESAVTNVRTVPYRTASFAGRMSRRLANREADRGWRRALALASQKQPSVAHIQWFMDPARDRKWVEALRARRVPVVLTAHNILPHDAPPESRRIWASIYEAVDAIIVHYQGALDELDALGVDLPKVSVIPHGNYCAIQGLTQHGGDAMGRRNAARRRLGLSPTAPVVLSFGLMRPYKGIQYLLPAFASVHKALPEARLILAGRAPDGFASVQADIARLGLDAVTLALPTYLPLQDAADVFEACDIVALPYVEASQSGVVQLAYAYSRPVVATRVGGIPEAVIDGKTGVLVEPRDTDQLAQAILTLLLHSEHRMRLGAQARQVALERFAWEPIAEQTALVYDTVSKKWPWQTGVLSRDDLRAIGK